MRKFLKKLFPILTVLAMLFIFSNSLSSGEEASAKRGFVVNILGFLFRLVTGEELMLNSGNLVVVSKIFHVAEFFLFSFCLSMSIYLLKGTLYAAFQNVLLCGVLTALADEQLQTLSPGRGPSLTDVFIDLAGVLLAFGVSFILAKILERKKKTQK